MVWDIIFQVIIEYTQGLCLEKDQFPMGILVPVSVLYRIVAEQADIRGFFRPPDIQVRVFKVRRPQLEFIIILNVRIRNGLTIILWR